MTNFSFDKKDGKGQLAKVVATYQVTDIPGKVSDKGKISIDFSDKQLQSKLLESMKKHPRFLASCFNTHLPVYCRPKVDGDFKGSLEELLDLCDAVSKRGGISNADLNKAKDAAARIAQLEGFLSAWELMPDAKSKGNLLAPFNVESKGAAEKELEELKKNNN